jgi:hypothetical protein
MVSAVVFPTAVVVIANVAVVAPAATVTLAGTVAEVVLLLDSVTKAPPVGAALPSVTVPVLDVPPATVVGLNVTEVSVGGFTVSVAVCVPLYVAEMVSAVVLPTALVVIAKVAVVAPAATVTLAGTVAAAVLLLDRVTTAPPVGAALLRVTVPVVEVPPVTVAGLKVTDDNVSVVVALTVTKALLDTIFPLASVMEAVIVKTEFAATLLGGVKTAVAPLPATVPLSADQEYCNKLPSTSIAVTDKLLVCELLILFGVATGPKKMSGAGLLVEPAGRPYTSISARPTLRPAPCVTVKVREVMVLGELSGTNNPSPFMGRAPTLILEPSLKVSVPARTLSVGLGLSCNTIVDTVTG